MLNICLSDYCDYFECTTFRNPGKRFIEFRNIVKKFIEFQNFIKKFIGFKIQLQNLSDFEIQLIIFPGFRNLSNY